VGGGFDGLYHFYHDEKEVSLPGLTEAFMNHTGWGGPLSHPYFIKGSEDLLSLFQDKECVSGITISTPGFYAPQVRSIRLSPFDRNLIEKIDTFSFNGLRINNFEMECSALYALSAMLGHEAITMCVAIANRITRLFLEDYKSHVDQLILKVLDTLAQHE